MPKVEPEKRYQENPDWKPASTDMTGTVGTREGSDQSVEEVSLAFQEDRQRRAAQEAQGRADRSAARQQAVAPAVTTTTPGPEPDRDTSPTPDEVVSEIEEPGTPPPGQPGVESSDALSDEDDGATTGDQEPEPQDDPYDNMDVESLRSLVGARGIGGRSKLTTKDALVQALREDDAKEEGS